MYKKIANLLSLLTLLAISSLATAATVATFDDLADGLVPSPYQGINWDDNWMTYSGAQDPYNPQSPFSRIYTNYDKYSAGVVSAVPFYFLNSSVFNGAYVSGNAGHGPVSFEMYYLGSLVATSIGLVQSSVPTFLASGYSGLVDEIRVIGQAGYYVLDNITYDVGNVNAIPVPAAAWLFATGLAGLGLTQRKRAKLIA